MKNPWLGWYKHQNAGAKSGFPEVFSFEASTCTASRVRLYFAGGLCQRQACWSSLGDVRVMAGVENGLKGVFFGGN